MRRSTHKKNLKRHMVSWEGSLVRRSTHKERFETPHGFLGRFFGAKVDSQKKLETPHMVFWFSGKVLWCTWVSGEGSLVLRSTHKKNLKRHMVFWEGSLVRRSTHKKKLETPQGFLGRFLVRRSTHKKS